jgi:large subunit ribosomal protein L25
MKISFELAAELRNDEGKGASRRLRHAGKVPAILYGGKRDPRTLTLNHEKLITLVEDEKFYSTIIGLKVGEETQAAIVKDLQMHPARNQVLHVDLQRVLDDEKIRIRLPIHFKGEAASPGVKTQGGLVSHRITDIEVTCLPKDLPEEIALDLSQMKLNESKYISDIPLPAGVVASAVLQGKDQVVVSIHSPRAQEPEAVAAEATAAAAPAAADAKKEEPKKEAAKK